MIIVRSAISEILLDAKNSHGRLYPADLTMEAFQTVLETPIPIEYGQPSWPFLCEVKQICGEVVKIERVESEIFVEWKILDTPAGHLIKEQLLIDPNLSITSRGVIQATDRGTVTFYKPISLYFSP